MQETGAEKASVMMDGRMDSGEMMMMMSGWKEGAGHTLESLPLSGDRWMIAQMIKFPPHTLSIQVFRNQSFME